MAYVCIYIFIIFVVGDFRNAEDEPQFKQKIAAFRSLNPDQI